MKFADVKNKLAFRKIFGDENRKEILISFLNAVLIFEKGKKIVSVDILTPYQLPLSNTGEITFVNINVKDQSNKNTLVEIAVADLEILKRRAMLYLYRSFCSLVQTGWCEGVDPTFFIGISDTAATLINKNYISRHRILDEKTHENSIKGIELDFIELPKFNKKPTELTSLTDQWVYFIKNAEDLKAIPDDVTDEGLKSAYMSADKYNWTKEELEIYNQYI